MKKKIQKYLAGEREGFSLVELIIVIAIMAILIGVVTLAVLPNIAKSKESKDMTALDSILSALNNAVASQQVSTSGKFYAKINNKKAVIKDASTTDKIQLEVAKLLGKDEIDLSSTVCQGADGIQCAWVFNGTSIGITVTVTNADTTLPTISTPVPGDYLGDFQVEN